MRGVEEDVGRLVPFVPIGLWQGALRRQPQRYIDQAHARKRALALERTRYLLSYFAGHPCVACGEADPVVLEFDHLGDKSFNIGRSPADRNWASILAEIEKCEVVCANCHRRRKALRRGPLRSVLTSRSRTDQRSGRPGSNRLLNLGRVLCNQNTSPARRQD